MQNVLFNDLFIAYTFTSLFIAVLCGAVGLVSLVRKAVKD